MHAVARTLVVLALVGSWSLACSSESPEVVALAPDKPSPSGPVDTPSPNVPAQSGGFDAPIGAWTWQSVPGSTCAQGAETGFGYKRGTGDKVFIYMEGGSLCADEDCKISPYYTKFTGYGPKEFFAALEQNAGEYEGKSGVDVPLGFRELGSVSPTFADASLVYVPYCSGDYFIGDTEKDWGSWKAQYRGKKNVALFFEALRAGFPNANRFILSGGSAGAVGANQNYHQAVSTFGGKRVDLITDSYTQVAPALPQFVYPVTGPVLPPDCPTCGTDYRTIYDYNSALATKVGGRIAILDTEDDWTLDWALFFLQSADYTKGLKNLQPYLDRLPNTKYYFADGNEHILMKHPLDSDKVDVAQGVVVNGWLKRDTHYLSEFLTRMQNDDPGWQSLSALRNDLLACETECNGRTCGADSCGGTCGTCPGGWTCDAGEGHCTK